MHKKYTKIRNMPVQAVSFFVTCQRSLSHYSNFDSKNQ